MSTDKLIEHANALRDALEKQERIAHNMRYDLEEALTLVTQLQALRYKIKGGTKAGIVLRPGFTIEGWVPCDLLLPVLGDAIDLYSADLKKVLDRMVEEMGEGA